MESTTPRCRALLLAAPFLLIAGCASAPPSDFLYRRGQEAHDAGDLDSALVYTERGMAQQPSLDHTSESALHLAILRELGRDEEADAFADFVARYEAGEDTGAYDPAAADACLRVQRERGRHERLIRRYGQLPASIPFEIGVVAASFAVTEDGRPIDIRVLRAEHPASAWLLIRSIADARISNARLADLAPEDFPLPHCVYGEYAGAMPATPVVVPPRMNSR